MWLLFVVNVPLPMVLLILLHLALKDFDFKRQSSLSGVMFAPFTVVPLTGVINIPVCTD